MTTYQKPLPPGKVQAFADTNGIDPAILAATPACRMSEGETAAREEYRNMRALIQMEPDVIEVVGLSWMETTGRWLYCIKTPFATWPKYVIGTTDTANENPEILFRCGQLSNALSEFNEQNFGDHL